MIKQFRPPDVRSGEDLINKINEQYAESDRLRKENEELRKGKKSGKFRWHTLNGRTV